MKPCRVCGGERVDRFVTMALDDSRELVIVSCRECETVRHRYYRRSPDAKEWDDEQRMSAPRSGWTADDGINQTGAKVWGSRGHHKSVGDFSLWVDEYEDGTADYRVTDMHDGRMWVMREREGLASVTAAKRAATKWASTQT